VRTLLQPSSRPGKLAKADRRERRLRRPVIEAKIRIQDLLAGQHVQPASLLERRHRRDPPDLT